MLDASIRSAILVLRLQDHSIRAIARAVKVSRDTVQRVLAVGSPAAPEMARPEKAEAHQEEILDLLPACKGNLIRVHEKLMDRGATLSYQALTGFCRRHGIGHERPLPSGQYHFEPGEEMQHDTSPHRVRVGDKLMLIQDASLVLCHSRMLFHQYYPTFNRFWCKVFLTEALEFFGGACSRCMIDNTHVVVLQGTGASMIAVPEMVAFGERFGFEFRAHAIGHANRSARVERPFDYIENNFLAGREFRDWADLNQQARAWCEKANATRKRSLQASPRELFLQERAQLRPLPIWVPTVYQLHHRIADVEGFVSVGGNRYSVPYTLIGHRLEVRETRGRIEVYDGHREVAAHTKVMESLSQRVTAPEHRPPRGQGRSRRSSSPEEVALLMTEPALAGYVAAFRSRYPGRMLRMLRRLQNMVRDYPRAPLLAAVATALEFGLFDLERLDRMVLRHIGRDYFVLEPAAGDLGHDPKEGGHEG
jgi:transposase